jgi:tryptophan synthase alpha chain
VRAIAAGDVATEVARLRGHTALPVTVGFGIKTPEQAATVGRFADGVVVGTAIVAKVAEAAGNKSARRVLVAQVAEFCAALAKAVHGARS